MRRLFFLEDPGFEKEPVGSGADRDLAPAAMEAVKQWKYKPYLLNQQPVQVDTQIVVNFELSLR